MPSSNGDAARFIRKTIELGGYRHAYTQLLPAKPTSPPVIAVHGFGTSGYRTYRHIARECAAAGIPLYALDLLGFGESEAPDVTYSLDLYARLIALFAERLALKRPLVMGHSMGGKVAAAAAVRYPGHFSALVLINSGGFARAERMLPFVARSWWARRLLAQDWFYYRILPQTPFGPVLQTEENRMQLRMLRHSHHALDLKRTGIRAGLRRLALPTLILWGERDRVLPRATPYRVQSFIPHAHLRMIPRAGHAPMKDQPKRFVDALAPFARERC